MRAILKDCSWPGQHEPSHLVITVFGVLARANEGECVIVKENAGAAFFRVS
jgi:hypothetical protein